MMWRRGLLWDGLLVVGCLLLLLGLGNIWWGEEGDADKSRSRQGLELPRVPMLRNPQPLSAFQVVSEKNLFSPDRQGGPGGKPSKAQASMEGGKLQGTFIIGPNKAALIAQGSAPRQELQVVRPGDNWGNMLVLDVTQEGVVLRGKEGQKTLNFPE